MQSNHRGRGGLSASRPMLDTLEKNLATHRDRIRPAADRALDAVPLGPARGDAVPPDSADPDSVHS
ncbi:hypothetical protein [Nonomuraea aurantiaca]|uniref:hypothetical protein n=1 Tax=Nonomuraea aurantiaca TaxID=2878562 RepID=UPI001CD97580|nr:hypothetical protein [Nonomuraea aurantiaca]MCA2222365.1 hypothetical protein [Nonomuraea aurantiaca]